MNTHNMFSSRNKKNIYLIPPLMKTYEQVGKNKPKWELTECNSFSFFLFFFFKNQSFSNFFICITAGVCALWTGLENMPVLQSKTDFWRAGQNIMSSEGHKKFGP